MATEIPYQPWAAYLGLFLHEREITAILLKQLLFWVIDNMLLNLIPSELILEGC